MCVCVLYSIIYSIIHVCVCIIQYYIQYYTVLYMCVCIIQYYIQYYTVLYMCVCIIHYYIQYYSQYYTCVCVCVQYLDTLFERDPKAGSSYHEQQVSLYADYDQKKLLPFLRACNDIPLQKVLPVIAAV